MTAAGTRGELEDSGGCDLGSPESCSPVFGLRGGVVRFGAPQVGEDLTQRVFANADLVTQLIEERSRNGVRVASELHFGGGPAGHIACAEAKGSGEETRFSPIEVQ